MNMMNGTTATLEPLLQLILRTSTLDLTYTLTASPTVSVVFNGPDVPRLLDRNAELLLALEHLATQALELEPHQHEQVCFDAGGFKAARQHTLERSAHTAAQLVRSTGRPYHFPPMNSRERRLLHLALTPSGLATQSEGEGGLRHLVLHPAS